MPALVKEYLHIVTAARWSSVEFPAHLHFTTHAIRAVGSEPGAAGKDHLLESCASQGWVLAQLEGAAHVFLHFTARLILWVSVLLTAGYQLQESCASASALQGSF